MRQFGTDLSMIQQLFPGRTRRQVKLKYKKEERQHPLRLREALTNRSKGRLMPESNLSSLWSNRFFCSQAMVSINVSWKK